VIAHEQTFTSEPSGGPFASSTEHLTPVATGEITAVTVTDQTSQATYRIADPPKDRQLRVVVEQHGLTPTGGGQAVMTPTAGGGDLIRLTIAHPTRGGVDFVARRLSSGPA